MRYKEMLHTFQNNTKKAAKGILKKMGWSSAAEKRKNKSYAQLCGHILLTGKKQIKAEHHILQYGVYINNQWAPKTLWMTHHEGLFSCLTTLMWTIRELQLRNIYVNEINNSLSMQQYKNTSFTNTYGELFCLESNRKDGIILPKINSSNKRGRFDHNHGNYEKTLEEELGREWLEAYTASYLRPSERLQKKIRLFTDKYELESKPTIFVYYRGTDKSTEVGVTQIEKYFCKIGELVNDNPSAQIVIQTDQKQVRDIFLQKYPTNCRYILELPVTSGSKGIHKTDLMAGNRYESCEDLIAMVIAASNCKLLITNTGNVGFTLAMFFFIKNKKFIQI